MTTKYCCGCKTKLGIHQFGKDRSAKDSLQSLCRSCKRKSFAKLVLCICELCSHNYHKRSDVVSAKKRRGTSFHCDSCTANLKPTLEQKRQTKAKGSAKYYKGNRDLVKARVREQAKLNLDYIKGLKKNPCMDCGENYPHYVMEFDHCRGHKRLNISVMTSMGYSIETLKDEVSKCELVCANCHRERTFSRLRT